MVHKSLDIAATGDIVVIAAGGSLSNAVLGDLICAKAKHRGIAGLIVDGLIRDLPGILELDFPVFAPGKPISYRPAAQAVHHAIQSDSMNTQASRFLTAEWRNLAMLSFEIDPKVLQPLVPAGTELDDWQGRTFVSVVGFMFLNTRVFGVPIPFHRNFEEVNLRFYVRRKASDGWRRGVVFVKEIVPRLAIALTARIVYGENYVAVPMQHRIEFEAGVDEPRSVSYSWWFRGRENRLELSVLGDDEETREGSDAEFITEHYWGYARRRGGRTMEYRVEHPRWRVSRATTARLDCDIASLYGSQFVEFWQAPPASAFLADGSEVTVFRGTLFT